MKKLCMLAAAVFAVTGVQAGIVPLVNGDFESYTGVAPGTAQVRGITDGVNQVDSSLSTLVGWSALPGSAWSDSGTELSPGNATRNLYLMDNDGATVYQMSTYTIGTDFGAAEQYQVTLDTEDIWEWAYLDIYLYAGDTGTLVDTINIYSDINGNGWYSVPSSTSVTFTGDYSAYAGSTLGIGFKNAGDIYVPGETTPSWLAIDNVSIQAIPEPATMGLVGFFGAGVLFVRRRLAM